MKIVHISTSNRGGAGIAAARLHAGMLDAGIDSKLLTLYKFDSNIKNHFAIAEEKENSIVKIVGNLFYKVLRKLNLIVPKFKAYEKKYLSNQEKGFERFSFSFSDIELWNHPLVLDSDIVHLHWVNEGMLDFEKFFQLCNKKIVWTLHDMNSFTGGCHHSDDCRKFQADCNVCPQLKNTIDDTIAKQMLSIKMMSLKNRNENSISIITPSKWLMNLSKSSILFSRFKHYVIPNVGNEHQFNIQNKQIARKQLGIPQGKYVVLFIAHHIDNPRKGIKYLQAAIKEVNSDDILLCAVGDKLNMEDELNIIELGYVFDENKMAAIYNACDLFVLPSLAENFPNTICESLLCGSPVVAFNVGGIPELIISNNGILVEKENSKELANAIISFKNGEIKLDREFISQEVKNKISSSIVIPQVINVYKSMLAT